MKTETSNLIQLDFTKKHKNIDTNIPDNSKEQSIVDTILEGTVICNVNPVLLTLLGSEILVNYEELSHIHYFSLTTNCGRLGTFFSLIPVYKKGQEKEHDLNDVKHVDIPYIIL